MDPQGDDLVGSLRTAYDGDAARRDRSEKKPWKLIERANFLRRLQEEQCNRLLEVGAGTGQDSRYFQDNGLDVVAVDLSPTMVARCREKGVDAYVRDFADLDFPPRSFDAVYAMNCLLHVPNAELPAVLDFIRHVIRPGGLFYVGVYGTDGAESSEGPLEDDVHEPPRFFSWRTDQRIQEFASLSFDLVDFHVVESAKIHFQSLTMRRLA